MKPAWVVPAAGLDITIETGSYYWVRIRWDLRRRDKKAPTTTEIALYIGAWWERFGSDEGISPEWVEILSEAIHPPPWCGNA